MIIKPGDAPTIWAANENYTSGPDAGTLTKVPAASTTDGHIAGPGNAPIAQNENFYRNSQDQWLAYQNELKCSVSEFELDETTVYLNDKTIAIKNQAPIFDLTSPQAGTKPTIVTSGAGQALEFPELVSSPGSSITQAVWRISASIPIGRYSRLETDPASWRVEVRPSNLVGTDTRYMVGSGVATTTTFAGPFYTIIKTEDYYIQTADSGVGSFSYNAISFAPDTGSNLAVQVGSFDYQDDASSGVSTGTIVGTIKVERIY